MPPFEELSNEQLLELAADLSAQLKSVRAELAHLQRRVDVERRKLRKTATKLGLNGALGAGGVLAAPITMGWSLVLTLGSAGMTAWDVYDYAHDRSEYKELLEIAANLRTKSQTTADRYESVAKAVNSRFGG